MKFAIYFCLLFCSYAFAQVPSDSLVLYYSFDESSGNIALDQSGNGHDATLVNSPARVAGISGNALAADYTWTFQVLTPDEAVVDTTLR